MNIKEAERKIVTLSLEGVLEGGDVLIIVSPTVWSISPIGSIHLLQAVCGRAGITTRVLYSNLHYLSLTGADLHKAIASEDYYLMEERLFASAAFGLPSQGRRMQEILESGWVPEHLCPKNKPIPDEFISAVISPVRDFCRAVDWECLESLTIQWLRAMAEQIVKKRFPIVACSTTHGGLASAIAFLNTIKKMDPHVITIIGGGYCREEMAEGIQSLKSSVDYIFSGEGDITFPGLAKQILAGRFPGEKIIYGEELKNLDENPLPDFQEYFDQKKSFLEDESGSGTKLITPYIPYETTRGCWFGRCTFCGFREDKNLVRTKSPEKILEDLKQLCQTYSKYSIYITDNMIVPRYYKTLFPRISAELPSLRLNYEIKANMTLDQLLVFIKAGATLLQPGIESLSSSLLKRMEKGVTVRENITLLRYARSLNLDLKWNILLGFPGDQTAEYEEMLNLFPLIHHLQPPRLLLPVRICRYSRYHRSPGEFGISHLHPAEVHKEVLPPHADLGKLAYLFTGEYDTQSFDNPELLLSLLKEVQAWKRDWVTYKFLPLASSLPKLHITRKSKNEYMLEDTRGLPGKQEKMVLDRQQAGILLVARPWHPYPQLLWALDADLGIVRDSWFIPLAAADSDLLQEFEHDYKPGK
ncbi:MAG: RiPP maturation radical SAM protein 1 [Candidatus Aminicenantes bacterium]|nr:RiPP maturation radical SAM protein 1 [Candidatus Aminicenantes bacterium]NIM77291.1 RiPP maturation radical SAM protein 1 [Candidatus Aminicenantes bacterium]NIN16592.1 RiPP maturation radical SAM protein 1 [Candidatus Aminicenantes bacterium]NIN40450.1 RiPP maturation radical SAM protein 1 [Candidatus Aminicenantes bacterium]NIN83270.1 RiPP maturation radical SAM protein 1 [Candidatus Aminicenantes bacterium]